MWWPANTKSKAKAGKGKGHSPNDPFCEEAMAAAVAQEQSQNPKDPGAEGAGTPGGPTNHANVDGSQLFRIPVGVHRSYATRQPLELCQRESSRPSEEKLEIPAHPSS